MGDAMNLERELQDLKRRVDLAETRLSQLEGQFGFISGQLEDIQLYMHARFDEHAQRLERIEAQVSELPRVIVETVRESEKRILEAIGDGR